jgi:hypothetical protein
MAPENLHLGKIGLPGQIGPGGRGPSQSKVHSWARPSVWSGFHTSLLKNAGLSLATVGLLPTSSAAWRRFREIFRETVRRATMTRAGKEEP